MTKKAAAKSAKSKTNSSSKSKTLQSKTLKPKTLESKALRSKTSKVARTPKKKTSAQLHDEMFLQLGEQSWPIERDVLYRPDRLKYVRKLIKPTGCVFCKAAKQVAFETLCVYQTEHSMVILNKFPYNSGHILVIPRRHCGDLLKLSEEESVDLHHTLRGAMKALNEVYQPGGMNIGMNHGATGGAGIPDHLHYHLIPRWSGDLNFFPLIAETKVVVESLEQTYERLLRYFSKTK